MATLKPVERFRADIDAEVLQDALQALNTDYEKGVTSLICLGTMRSAYQRYVIVNTHQKVYGTFAPNEIKKVVSGWTCEGLWALYMPAALRDATWLHEAMVGIGADEEKLAEILCTRTSSQLEVIADAYKKLYGTDLASGIHGETWAFLQQLFCKLLCVTRDTGPANRRRASSLAQELYDAGVGMSGTDESKFIDIVTRESVPQLRQVFSAYLTKYQKTIIDAIHAEFSGKVRAALVVLVRGILNPSHYFADRIREAVVGFGTDEAALIRCIIGRADIDLEQIKSAYAAKYKTEVGASVSAEVDGDFEQLLLAVSK